MKALLMCLRGLLLYWVFATVPLSFASSFPASASVNVNCSGVDQIFVVGADPGFFACQHSFTDAAGAALETSAVATLIDATSPSINVSAFINNQIDDIDPGLAVSRSVQDLTYYFSIQILSQPPAGLTDIPINFSAQANAASSGSFTVEGGAFIVNADGVGVGDVFNTDNPSMNYVLRDNFSVGVDYRVTLEADCSSQSIYVGASECSANVFSSVQFDQALFDQMLGNESFTLSDYYEINLSPNLVVPLPMSFYLLLSALSALWAVRYRLG